MRFYHMENGLSQSRPPTDSEASNWIGSVSVWLTVAAFIVAALISFKWAIIVATLVAVALSVFLWSVGVRKKRARGKADTGR